MKGLRSKQTDMRKRQETETDGNGGKTRDRNRRKCRKKKIEKRAEWGKDKRERNRRK